MTATRGIIGRSAGVEMLRSYGILAALLVLIVVTVVLQPIFISPVNLANLLSQWAPVAIMGIGMTYTILVGGLDLSVGAIFTMSSVVAAGLGQAGYPPLISFGGAIVVGGISGVLNAFVVTILRVDPFIATLGTSFVIAGLALVITGNKPLVVQTAEFGFLGNGRILGIPYSGLLMIALMIIAGLVLKYTYYGRRVYAVGGNAEASRLMGVSVAMIKGSTYVISGLCAGVAGVISASQLGYIQGTGSQNLLFDVLTVVVLGGTSLAGGFGAIWRTAVGVGILATMQNGFNLMHVDPYYQNIIKGVIIIVALTLDSALRERMKRPRAARSAGREATEPVSPAHPAG